MCIYQSPTWLSDVVVRKIISIFKTQWLTGRALVKGSVESPIFGK